MKKLYLLSLCLLVALSASALDRFYINDFSVCAGETKQVEIMLDNETSFSALQADIYLPEGLTIEQEDGNYLFELTDRKGLDHTVSSRKLSSGAIRIVIASQSLKVFSGNSGALVTFNIIADASFSGTKQIVINHVIASEVNQAQHNLPETSCSVTSHIPGTNDMLYISDFGISAGETKQVEIMLDNELSYTALQADIYLPQGLTIEQEDGEYLFNLTSRKGSDHTIASTLLSNGAIRIVVLSPSLQQFGGNSGALVTFNISADASFTETNNIQLKRILVSEENQTQHALPNTTCIVTYEGNIIPPPGSNDALYINDFGISAGETKQVEIMLDNELAYTALQADIYLPQGLTIEQEDGEYLFNLTSRKGSDHTIASTKLSNGAVRIVVLSPSLQQFGGNSGPLVTFNISADASFTESSNIQLKRILVSEENQVQHALPDTTCIVTYEGSIIPPPGSNDKFYINDFTIMARETKQVEIMLDNELPYTALQADIYMPEGLTIKQENGEYFFNLTDRKGSDHTVASTLLSNGAIRIVVLSPSLQQFGGDSGALVTFNVTANASIGESEVIEIKHILASEDNQAQHALTDTTCTVTRDSSHLLGDVNCDGAVTSVDITCIYNYLLNGDETYIATSDVNGDGFITSVDITVIYNILLGE